MLPGCDVELHPYMSCVPLHVVGDAATELITSSMTSAPDTTPSSPTSSSRRLQDEADALASRLPSTTFLVDFTAFAYRTQLATNAPSIDALFHQNTLRDISALVIASYSDKERHCREVLLWLGKRGVPAWRVHVDFGKVGRKFLINLRSITNAYGYDLARVEIQGVGAMVRERRPWKPGDVRKAHLALDSKNRGGDEGVDDDNGGGGGGGEEDSSHEPHNETRSNEGVSVSLREGNGINDDGNDFNDDGNDFNDDGFPIGNDYYASESGSEDDESLASLQHGTPIRLSPTREEETTFGSPEIGRRSAAADLTDISITDAFQLSASRNVEDSSDLRETSPVCATQDAALNIKTNPVAIETPPDLSKHPPVSHRGRQRTDSLPPSYRCTVDAAFGPGTPASKRQKTHHALDGLGEGYSSLALDHASHLIISQPSPDTAPAMCTIEFALESLQASRWVSATAIETILDSLNPDSSTVFVVRAGACTPHHRPVGYRRTRLRGLRPEHAVVVIPINHDNLHWTVAVAMRSQRKLVLYDSRLSRPWLTSATTALNDFTPCLEFPAEPDLEPSTISIDKPWAIETASEGPIQTDHCSCGVYITLFALYHMVRLPVPRMVPTTFWRQAFRTILCIKQAQDQRTPIPAPKHITIMSTTHTEGLDPRPNQDFVEFGSAVCEAQSFYSQTEAYMSAIKQARNLFDTLTEGRRAQGREVEQLFLQLQRKINSFTDLPAFADRLQVLNEESKAVVIPPLWQHFDEWLAENARYLQTEHLQARQSLEKAEAARMQECRRQLDRLYARQEARNNTK